MKVLIIISSFYMGGFSKSLINFLKCAEQYKNIDISILSLDENKTEQKNAIPLRFRHIELAGLDLKSEPVKGLNFGYLLNRQRIRNLRYKIYAMYCSLKKKSISNYIAKEFIQYSWINKANRVTNDFSFAKEYDYVISWEEGFCNYLLVDRIPAKKKIGYIHPNYLEINMNKHVDKKYIKKLDRIVTISDSCYRTLCKVFPQYQEKIVCLPNRLHIASLKSMADEYEPEMKIDEFNILTVARIVDYDKAVFRIVSLAKRLLNDNFEYRWYIIGDGIDLLELKRRILKENLQDYVICLGEKINPCPYMKAADLFVMQSNREGRPVAVDEAMALGTPALITNYSSAYEQVVDGTTGWIADNNERCIYEKLKNILSNTTEIQKVKENLRKVDLLYYENIQPMIDMLNSID